MKKGPSFFLNFSPIQSGWPEQDVQIEIRAQQINGQNYQVSALATTVRSHLFDFASLFTISHDDENHPIQWLIHFPIDIEVQSFLIYSQHRPAWIQIRPHVTSMNHKDLKKMIQDISWAAEYYSDQPQILKVEKASNHV